MNKAFHIIPLLGVAISVFQIVKSNASPVIYEDERVTRLNGFDDYDCRYGSFPDSHHTICLSGINADYSSIETVQTFYASQMEDLGWAKTPVSLHETPISNANTEFYLKETSTSCDMERAITVNQNTYRGGIKLEDISIKFSEYLVACNTIEIEPLFRDDVQ